MSHNFLSIMYEFFIEIVEEFQNYRIQIRACWRKFGLITKPHCKMLKTSALKRSLLKLCYLQIDEVHWLMKGWSSKHLKFILRLMSWVLTVHHFCLTERTTVHHFCFTKRTTVHHFCLTKRTTVHHFCLTKSQMNKRPHAASA